MCRRPAQLPIPMPLGPSARNGHWSPCRGDSGSGPSGGFAALHSDWHSTGSDCCGLQAASWAAWPRCCSPAALLHTANCLGQGTACQPAGRALLQCGSARILGLPVLLTRAGRGWGSGAVHTAPLLPRPGQHWLAPLCGVAAGSGVSGQGRLRPTLSMGSPHCPSSVPDVLLPGAGVPRAGGWERLGQGCVAADLEGGAGWKPGPIAHRLSLEG